MSTADVHIRGNLDTDLLRGKTLWRRNDDMTFYNPGREASEQTRPATVSSLGSSLQNCEKINFCL